MFSAWCSAVSSDPDPLVRTTGQEDPGHPADGGRSVQVSWPPPCTASFGILISEEAGSVRFWGTFRGKFFTKLTYRNSSTLQDPWFP